GTLPRRAPKPEKPLRHGIAWVAIDAEGRVLTERRREGGLLGGMLAVPATDPIEASLAARPSMPGRGQPADRAGCSESGASGDGAPSPPLPGVWHSVGEVRHVFTHFRLRLDVRRLRLADGGGAGFLPIE